MSPRPACVLFLALTACDKPADTGPADDTAPDDGLLRLTILHTNDTHSHLLGLGPDAEYTGDTTGDDLNLGGMARVAALAAEIRAGSDHPVLMLDAGDWMAGSLFQLLAESHAAELQVAQAMGYDAMALGNHEFDWGPEALASMVSAGDAAGVTVPLLAANLVPSDADPGDDALAAHVASGRIAGDLVLTLDNGLTVGIFGLLGEDAAAVAPNAAPVTFADSTATAAAEVAALDAQGVDLVLGLTHVGLTDDPATSPDEILAADVPGIDVIVGGHSHTPLSKVRTAETGTVIVQAGANSAWLGQLDLAYDGTAWAVEGYTLHTVDDTVADDPTVAALIDDFRAALDAGPLADLGYAFDQPIASLPADMPAVGCVETGLGDLVTDAYRARMNLTAADPVDFAFESQGVIRDGLMSGNAGVASFSDVFRVLPLGYGTDGVPGYALVDFYVTAAELLDTCEVTASISPGYGCNYFIEVSGLRCILDMERSQFNRAQEVQAWDGEAWVALDDEGPDLYHVAVDSYVASLMGILESLTFGAIVITPKDATGTPHSDVAGMTFDADPEAAGLQELKLWQALAAHAAAFDDTDGDGTPDVPASYAEDDGRIVGWE